jgi:hypothetical protein
VQHYQYSISDVEDLMPFERDIFVDMLVQFIEQQKESSSK